MFILKLGSELQNLVKTFAVQYENINKLQTAFPRSGIFPRSGMHREQCKMPPTSFSPVTSTNVALIPQNFMTFSFNPFATLG